MASNLGAIVVGDLAGVFVILLLFVGPLGVLWPYQ